MGFLPPMRFHDIAVQWIEVRRLYPPTSFAAQHGDSSSCIGSSWRVTPAFVDYFIGPSSVRLPRGADIPGR
jgi:hypothetical protein